MPHNHAGTAVHHSETPAREVEVDLTARETEWEIAPGRTIKGWGFNRRIPGPTIEARQGDTLVVRFTNDLPEPTTIHWHGIRLNAAMDGSELVQQPIRPGETFEYRFSLPDSGTFWYHPHMNETVQMEMGLYGALIVHGSDPLTVDAERVLVFDDMRLKRKDRFARFGGWLERHNGREGNTRVINGLVEPELSIAAGTVERWRVINAASARYIRLSIGGRRFRIIGSDGGLISAPVEAGEVLIPPGKRFELAVGPFEEGAELAIESLPYNRGTGTKRVERFGTLRVGESSPTIARIPEVLREITPLADSAARPTRTVRLGGRMSLRRGVDFLINDEQHHDDAPVRVGELQVWDVVNETPIDHPFHLHGFFFQVLEQDGAKPPYLAWEDTANIRAKSRVRIAWMPDDRVGSWMYHCHILEHTAAGMMGHFDVVRDPTAEPPKRYHSHHH